MYSVAKGETKPLHSRRLTQAVSTMGMATKTRRPMNAGALNSQPRPEAPLRRIPRLTMSVSARGAPSTNTEGLAVTSSHPAWRYDPHGVVSPRQNGVSPSKYLLPRCGGVGDDLVESHGPVDHTLEPGVEHPEDVAETGDEAPAMGVVRPGNEGLQVGMGRGPRLGRRLDAPASR